LGRRLGGTGKRRERERRKEGINEGINEKGFEKINPGKVDLHR